MQTLSQIARALTLFSMRGRGEGLGRASVAMMNLEKIRKSAHRCPRVMYWVPLLNSHLNSLPVPTLLFCSVPLVVASQTDSEGLEKMGFPEGSWSGQKTHDGLQGRVK